jgi:hypothetical protein
MMLRPVDVGVDLRQTAGPFLFVSGCEAGCGAQGGSNLVPSKAVYAGGSNRPKQAVYAGGSNPVPSEAVAAGPLASL